MATACLTGRFPSFTSLLTFSLNAFLEALFMSGMVRSRVRANKICKQCGTPFSVPNYRKETAYYCGLKCKALHSRQQLETECAQCGKLFSHISSRANVAKYCSPVCYRANMSKRGTVNYVCAHCGSSFLGSPSHKRKFCSMSCVNKRHKSEWNPSFSAARSSMLRRGMITKCEVCGFDSHPAILGVHHKDRNRSNNHLSNLSVLCPNCHSMEHMRHIPHGAVS